MAVASPRCCVEVIAIFLSICLPLKTCPDQLLLTQAQGQLPLAGCRRGFGHVPNARRCRNNLAFTGVGEELDFIKENFGQTVPEGVIPGGSAYELRLAEMISRPLRESMTLQEALDQEPEERNKLTKRRGMKKRPTELGRRQMATTRATGATPRLELADTSLIRRRGLILPLRLPLALQSSAVRSPILSRGGAAG